MSERDRLDILRAAYAKRLMATAQIRDERLESAFARVPRERYLGAPPWPILRWGAGYVPTPDDDPLYIYDDVLVGLDPARKINNGQPSWHVRWLAALVLRRAPMSCTSVPAPATTAPFSRTSSVLRGA